MDPAMPPATRTDRFYQHDHLRCFGTMDFADRFLRLFDGMERRDVAALLPGSVLQQAGLRSSLLRHDTGHTPYVFFRRQP
jgi:hypothetical protein